MQSRIINLATTVVLLSGALGNAPSAMAVAPPSSHQAKDVSVQPDQSSVRSELTSMSKLISAGDVPALAALWSKDGTYTDCSGGVFKGRDSIAKRLSAGVLSNRRRAITLIPNDVRELSATISQVQGDVKRADAAGNLPEARFSMLLTKDSGKWQIASLSETPVAEQPDTNRDYLKDLSWLIGEWKAERDGKSLRLKASWSGNKNFIRCNYEISKQGQPTQEDVELIGFDPRTQQVKSWNFESNGAIGEGVWEKTASGWEIDSAKVSRDGITMTARNMLSVKAPNSFSWQSIDRTSGGVPLNDTGELQLVRSTH
jgi:ketosteroid isomerase-like protein